MLRQNKSIKTGHLWMLQAYTSSSNHLIQAKLNDWMAYLSVYLPGRQKWCGPSFPRRQKKTTYRNMYLAFISPLSQMGSQLNWGTITLFEPRPMAQMCI